MISKFKKEVSNALQDLMLKIDYREYHITVNFYSNGPVADVTYKTNSNKYNTRQNVTTLTLSLPRNHPVTPPQDTM